MDPQNNNQPLQPPSNINPYGNSLPPHPSEVFVPQPIAPPPKSNKRLIIISVLTLALIVVAVAIYLLTKSKDVDNEQVPRGSSISQPDTTTNQNGQASVSARDTERNSDINMLHAKLEEYYYENAAYPQTFTAASFPGIDAKNLIDPKGRAIKISPAVADSAAALAVGLSLENSDYVYAAYPLGCTDNCTGYVLKSLIEAPSQQKPNPYIKIGLNNN